jgi:hypothetical protein
VKVRIMMRSEITLFIFSIYLPNLSSLFNDVNLLLSTLININVLLKF